MAEFREKILASIALKCLLFVGLTTICKQFKKLISLKKHFFLVICISLVCAPTSCKKTVECIDYSKVDPNIVCPTYIDPVCGCDDITYENECVAKKNGVRSWIKGPC